MNYIKPEQIKEYVNQNPTGIGGMSEDLATMVNHFAELIVQECLNQGDKLSKHYIDTHTEQEQSMLLAAVADYSQAIKHHFGVEE
jgi:hypothetical protein